MNEFDKTMGIVSHLTGYSDLTIVDSVTLGFLVTISSAHGHQPLAVETPRLEATGWSISVLEKKPRKGVLYMFVNKWARTMARVTSVFPRPIPKLSEQPARVHSILRILHAAADLSFDVISGTLDTVSFFIHLSPCYMTKYTFFEQSPQN